MYSGRGQLSVDGNEPFAVDYDLDDTGRGYLAASRAQVVNAHLGHSVALTAGDRKTFRIIVDSVGSVGGGDFHVIGAEA